MYAVLRALCLAVNLLFGFRKFNALSTAFSSKISVVATFILAGGTGEGLFKILFFLIPHLKWNYTSVDIDIRYAVFIRNFDSKME